MTIFRYNDKTQEYKKVEITPDGLLVITNGKKGDKANTKRVAVKLTPAEALQVAEALQMVARALIKQEFKRNAEKREDAEDISELL